MLRHVARWLGNASKCFKPLQSAAAVHLEVTFSISPRSSIPQALPGSATCIGHLAMQPHELAGSPSNAHFYTYPMPSNDPPERGQGFAPSYLRTGFADLTSLTRPRLPPMVPPETLVASSPFLPPPLRHSPADYPQSGYGATSPEAFSLHPSFSDPNALPHFGTGSSANQYSMTNAGTVAHGLPVSLASTARRSNKLPAQATYVLRKWFFDHLQYPYPTEAEKKDLVDETGLTNVQVSDWFINARRRKPADLPANPPATASSPTSSYSAPATSSFFDSPPNPQSPGESRYGALPTLPPNRLDSVPAPPVRGSSALFDTLLPPAGPSQGQGGFPSARAFGAHQPNPFRF